MTDQDRIDIDVLHHGFTWLIENEGLVMPHGESPLSLFNLSILAGSQGITPDGLWVTPAWWAAYVWNPDPVDPAASPKPTWEDLFRGSGEILVGWIARNILRDFEEIVGNVVRELDSELLEYGYRVLSHGQLVEGGLYVGKGIESVEALIAKIELATIAGNEFKPVTLRSHDGGSVLLFHHPWELRKVILDLLERKNIIEGAVNRYAVRAKSDADSLLDASTSLQDRLSRISHFKSIYTPDYVRDAFARHMEAEDHQFGSLPVWPPWVVQDALIHRVEAAAAKRTSEVSGALDQQGVDLHPSCAEQDQALALITHIKQKAQRDLLRTDPVEDMKTLASVAIDEIESIVVQNTPVWQDALGEPLALNANGEHVVAFHYDPMASQDDLGFANFRAVNPIAPIDPGVEAIYTRTATPLPATSPPDSWGYGQPGRLLLAEFDDAPSFANQRLNFIPQSPLALPQDLVVGGAAVELDRVGLEGDTGKVRFRTALENERGGLAGPDLTAEAELGLKIVFTVGDLQLEVAHPIGGGIDVQEPYVWIPANFQEVKDFVTAYGALTGSPAVTVRIGGDEWSVNPPPATPERPYLQRAKRHYIGDPAGLEAMFDAWLAPAVIPEPLNFGEVAIHEVEPGHRGTWFVRQSIPIDMTDAHQARLFYRTAWGVPEPGEYRPRLIASNACGPSALKLKITVTVP